MAQPTSQPLQGSTTRWGIVLLALLAGIVCAMQLGKVPPALSDIRLDLAIGMVTAGWVASIFNLTGGVPGVAAGSAGDGLGHRRVIVMSLVCIGVGSLIGAFADGVGLLLATRLLEGLGYIGILVAAPSLVIQVTSEKDLGVSIGFLAIFLPTGFAGMMLLSPLFLETSGWRSLWIANAIIAAAVVIMFAVGTRGLAGASARKSEPSGWNARATANAITRPGAILLSVGFMTFGMQFFGLTAWLPTFLIEERGETVADAAILSAAVIFMNAVGNLTAAWCFHRGVPRWILFTLGPILMGVFGFGVLGDLAPDGIKYWLAIVFALSSGIVPPAVMASVPVHAPAPNQIGAMNGLIMQTNSVGFMIAPPIFAALVTATRAWHVTGWLMLVLGAIGAATALGVRAVEARR